MSERKTPPFRADHVGSLLRPQKLREARAQRLNGAISAADLAKVEDEAIRAAVKLQEDVGLKVATDGEFRRTSWSGDFLQGISGIKQVPGKLNVRFHSHEGSLEQSPPAMRTEAKLGRPKPITVEDFKFVKSVTKVTPKMTIPSPTMIHFRGGRDQVDKNVYPEMDGFFADLAAIYAGEIADLAAAGCRYLQLDDTNYAYLCDPELRRQVRSNVGENPDELPHTYAKLVNAAIAKRPKDMVVCMHICRGNARSAWVAEGGYEPVAESLFQELDLDGYFLEYDSLRAGDFQPLRYVPRGKIIILGLVTTKLPKLETKDELKRRIDEAAHYVPLEQLALSPQCGFSSTHEGNKVTVEDEIAKLRLVVEVAQEVWG